MERARGLRTRIGPDVRIAAVLDTAAYVNPLLRVRLAHAGVAEVLHRSQVADANGIGAVADGRVTGRSTEPDPSSLMLLGVGRRTDPCRVIERVLELGTTDPAYLRAFTPGTQQNESGLSRRRAHTLRVKVAELGHVLPDPAGASGGPQRDRSLPRWSEIVEFVNLWRGWEPPGEVCRLDGHRIDGHRIDGHRRDDQASGEGSVDQVGQT